MEFEDVAIYYLLEPGAEQERGPLTLRQIRDEWTRGTVSAEMLFAVEGMDGWKPLEEIRDKISGLREVPIVGEAAPPVLLTPPRKRRSSLAVGLGVCAGCVGLFMAGMGLWQALKTPEQKERERANALRVQAYYMAEYFTEEMYPGKQEFLGIGKAAVRSEEDLFTVELRLDTPNAFGGIVRKTIQMDMRLLEDGETWRMLAVRD